MPESSPINAVPFRMERARECLSDAQAALLQKRYRNAANRAYYAVFNAARALLNLLNQDYRKHSGVISEFRRVYVKTGLFAPRFSDMIGEGFLVRNACDYENYYVVDAEIIAHLTANAETFVCAVERYLLERVQQV